MVNLRNQVLSRRVVLAAGVAQDVLDFVRPNQTWRLSVQERTGTSSILVQVTTGFDNSEEMIQFHVSASGACEYVGCNSAQIKLQAGANCTVDVQVGPTLESQYVLERDSSRFVIAPGAWTPVGAIPPYMNYAAILTDANIDVRTISTGITMFQGLGLPPQTLLLNQFKVGNHDQLELQGTAVGQNARVVWYNRR